MRSSRWDAQGNVYLVVTEPMSPELVRAGVEDTDGVLEVFRSGDDWVEIAIWNTDGSTAELSGNGTRIAAKWLAEETGADVVTVRVGPREVIARMLDGGLVEQDLGEVEVGSAEEVDGIRFVAVDIGNPHAVVGGPAPVYTIGPFLEVHERFPRRTNVQVARRVSDDEIEARVWERGAGETASSKSNAGAVAGRARAEAGDGAFPGRRARRCRFEDAAAFLSARPRRIQQVSPARARRARGEQVRRRNVNTSALGRPALVAEVDHERVDGCLDALDGEVEAGISSSALDLWSRIIFAPRTSFASVPSTRPMNGDENTMSSV